MRLTNILTYLLTYLLMYINCQDNIRRGFEAEVFLWFLKFFSVKQTNH